MRRIASELAVLSIATLAAGCSLPIALAPGADSVHITKNSADVVACTAVGNVDARQYGLDPRNAMRQMQNQTVGLGGNTLFVTLDPAEHLINSPDAFATGISYRCPTSGAAGK